MIVEYGGGNIASVRNALTRLGIDSDVAATPEAVLAADRLILPGVGSGGAALTGLRARGLDLALDEAVRRKGRPMLGICVGMQVLAERLFEFGTHEGLGWFKGDIVHLREVAQPQRVPHMGWSAITPDTAGLPLFRKLRQDRQFYFCHSYTLRGEDAASVAATADHGGRLVAALARDTVWAVQFHPEKSQMNGEALFEAFVSWSP